MTTSLPAPRLLAVLVAAFGSIAAFAAPPDASKASLPAGVSSTVAARVRVTLPEALRRALDQNPGFRASRQDAEIARGRRRQAQAPLRPMLGFSAYETHQSIPDVVVPGLGGLFGGKLFVDEVRDKRVTLTQQLLNVRDHAGSRAARSMEKAARQEVTKASIDLVTSVKTAFYDLLLAEEMSRVTKATADQVERQLTQARLNVRVGTAPRLDELRAEVQLSRARADLIRAGYGADIAREVLANLLALEASTPLEVAGTFLPSQPVPDRAAVLAKALRERPDLRASRERLEAAHQGLRAARAGRLPTVALVGTKDRSFNQSFIRGEEIDVQAATVSVNLPLFDGGLTDGRVTEARAAHRKAAAELESLEHAVELDVTRSLALVEQARAVIAATETAVQLAQEALDIAEEGYRQGVRTYLEVLDAQLALAVARTNLAQARRDDSVARARLDQAQGQLTGLDEPSGPGPTATAGR
jgi:TolC family type I secretion outer membrane protein